MKQNRRKFFKITGSALGIASISKFSESLSLANNIDPFTKIRSQLYIPANRIYLNTGTLGPSPKPVIQTVFETIEHLETNPAVENFGPLGKVMENIRTKIGKFINTPSEQIILTRNTTEGLSLIGQTLQLKPGDEILTTTREHGGGLVGFEYMAERDGAVIQKVVLPLAAESKQSIIDLITKAITEKTKIILLSHINTVTGLKMPFPEIAKIIKNKDILLIADGAQAPGLIPIDIQQLGVDAYATSGHKWLMGPKETGFLFVSQKLIEGFNPVFTSKGFSAYSASSGTRNVAQFIGLGKAIDIQQELDTKFIEQRCLILAEYCRKKLSDLDHLELISPKAKELQTGIVSFSLTKGKNSAITNQLKAKDIIVKTSPEKNALRFSCHYFVTEKDIDRLYHELQEILKA